MALDLSRSIFYVVQEPSAEVGLHADKNNLIIQNEA
jgi:hypothetical protein